MRAAIIAAAVALLVSATSATAALVVTSQNIKNGTIQTVDISAKAKRALRGIAGLIAATPDDIGIRCWRTGESGSLGTGLNPRIMYG